MGKCFGELDRQVGPGQFLESNENLGESMSWEKRKVMRMTVPGQK
jgi:hypothetical protein